MKDRWGDEIRVGWADHETLWIKAALSLGSKAERQEAYKSIAEMSGRSLESVIGFAMRTRMADIFKTVTVQPHKPSDPVFPPTTTQPEPPRVAKIGLRSQLRRL